MNNQQQPIVDEIRVRCKQCVNFLKSYRSYMQLILPENKTDEELISLIMEYSDKPEDYDNDMMQDDCHAKLKKIRENSQHIPECLKKINIITNQFNDKEYVQKLSLQYLNVVLAFFQNSGITGDIHSTTDESVIFERLIKYDFADFYNMCVQLNSLDCIKDIEHSVVIIGANGSGKSTFSRNIRQFFPSVSAIISAQKIFSYESLEIIPIGNKTLQNVLKFQVDTKIDVNNTNILQYQADMLNLITSLIAEHNNKASQYYSASKTGEEKIRREDSKLEKVMEIWNELIEHREMKYVENNIKIFYTKDKTKAEYDFSKLSDGEKAVIYYIAHIMLSPENSYIIVDEPENHLHMGVVSKLWG